MPTFMPLLAALSLPLQLCCAAEPGPAAKRDVLEKIDRVIADPGDAAARSSLAKAAGAVSAAEQEAYEKERDALVSSAKSIEAGREALGKRKARRLSAWKKKFSAASDLAGDPSRLPEAVSAYERCLEAFPLYADGLELLNASSERIRGVFLATIRKHFPYLAEGERALDDRMLAGACFSALSGGRDLFGGAERTDLVALQLKKAARLRELENGLRSRHGDLSRGVLLYKKGALAASAESFQKVLYSDAANDEALYYSRLITSRRVPSAPVNGD